MAKKVQTDDNDDVEEIFTDLRGNPDPSPSDADVLNDLSAKPARKSKVQADAEDQADPDDDDDSDPLMMDDVDEGEDPDPSEAADEEDEEAPAEEEIEEPTGEDPRDLQLRKARLDLLEERAQRFAEQANTAKSIKEQAARTMESATARIKAAKEAGNTDDEMAAQKDYLDARENITRADSAIGMIENGRALLKADLDKIGFDFKTGQLVERTTERTAAPAKLTGNAAKFIEANKKWMNDPKFKTKSDLLFQLDRDMGNDPKWKGLKAKPEYFEELGKRFNRVAPGVARGLDGKLIATGSRQRGTGASAGTGSTGVSRDTTGRPLKEAGKVRFEESDKREMQKFGLDPGRKTHRAAWLREKQSVNVQSGGRA